MALAVIGAGFGRTGTLSLKVALEQLGLGRCYHMLEVFANPGHAAQWQAAADGKPVDWEALFAGYGAAVDWPACHFWRALAARYPEAKVLLTVREPGAWYKSVSDTIYQARLDGPVGMVMGAEGEGLRRLTQDTCDLLVSIPMLGSVESLNVSVASGVCLYEARRRRLQGTVTGPHQGHLR